MPEILPHPFGGSPPDPVSDPQRTLRGGCLQFVSERVVIPAVAVVQKTPDGAEEVDRAGAKLFFCGSDFTNFFFLIHDVPQPNRGLKVAHPARRFLYVWLQVKNRISITSQPLLGKPVKLSQQEWASLPLGSRQNFGIQSFEQSGIARKKSP